MKYIASIALLLAACNCTANIEATVDQSDCEWAAGVELEPSPTSSKLRAKDVVIEDTLQVGSEVPEDDTQRVVFSAIDTLTRVMVTIDSDTTNHNSGGGSNQITNLWLKATGGFDTTTQDGVNRALEITAACSVDTGAGTCEDTAIIANAANGYSWRSETGTMRHDGAVLFGSGMSPASVSLGANVQPFLLQGTNGTATQIHVGWPTTPGNVFSGVGVAVKNAQPSVSVTGVGVALDTSISGASGIRGGFLISRGANGGLVSGNTAGIAVAGGTGFPWVASAANEFNLYNQLGTSIFFGANNVSYVPAFKLTPKDHIAVEATGVPARDAGCDAGTGEALVGTDMAFKLTTGSTSTACTVTFANTWTSAPICTITREGGTTVPTFTVSATAVTFSVNASSAVYNVICIGVPGST